ncbi:MAG: hypothetical protein ACLQVD_02245 [Capsulimonadaceae bacterium]
MIIEPLARAVVPAIFKLVHVDAGAARRERLRIASMSDEEMWKRIDQHSTEADAHDALPARADLVLDGDLPPSDMVRTVMSAVAKWICESDEQSGVQVS